MGASNPQIELAIAVTDDPTSTPFDVARSVVRFDRLPASTAAIVHSVIHYLLTKAVG